MIIRTRRRWVALMTLLLVAALMAAQAPTLAQRAAMPDARPVVWFEYGMGAVPSQGDLPLLDTSNLRSRLSALPPSIDLSGALPPVGRQGRQSSCVGWTVGYYGKTWQEQVERGWGTTQPEHQFSPSWIYNQRATSNCAADEGMSIYEGLSILQNQGAATLATFPYQVDDPCVQPPQAAHDEAWQYRIESFAAVFGGAGNAHLPELKAILAGGQPLLVGVPVYHPSCWPDSSPPMVPAPSPDVLAQGPVGDHGVLVVGYDDHVGGFRFVNSWGTGYGDGGFAYLSYAFMQAYAWEAWVMTDHIDASSQATLSLRAGWNLVSLPVVPSNDNPQTLLAPIADALEELHVYDASAGRWLRYLPSAPSYTNSLQQIPSWAGLWLKARSDASLSLSGTPRQGIAVSLTPGWNLVAYPGSEALPAELAIASLGNSLDMAHGYEAVSGAWTSYHPSTPALNTLTEMLPGQSYWLNVREPCSWRID